MKNGLLKTPCHLALFAVLPAALSSCKMPSQQAWSKIQKDGLVGYMAGEPMQRKIAADSASSKRGQTVVLTNFAFLEPIEGLPKPTASSGAASGSRSNGILGSSGGLFLSSKVATAKPVPGRAGYVYSPHAAGKMVDVTRFKGGAQVRCPHTERIFAVPGYTLEKSAVASSRSMVRDTRTSRVAQNPRADRQRMSFSPHFEPSPGVADPEPETTIVRPQEAPKPDGLMATMVPGRMNQVYSPYAGKRQIVDVTGLKPGEKARCPYTERVFIVPGAATIVSTAAANKQIAEISENVEFKVLGDRAGMNAAANKKTTAPTSASATPSPPPAPSSAPVANWSGQNGYVISPHGGQMVDVSGKSAGSEVRCPFSGKLFRVPAGSN